ncbi:MAG: hypothetical protein EBU88_17620 [Acidobacteria bacterium]|nr:hypothetical protein [Acidobacteriota bacterium]
MAFNTILNLVGIGLVLLSGASGIALFLRAIGSNESQAQGPGMTTLWGLFLIGLITGLLLISISSAR